MKPIKFNEVVSFTKPRNDGYQKCVYCLKPIGKGNVALSLVKQLGNKKGSGRFNVWLHTNCIDEFFSKIILFKQENIKEILINQIQK